MFMDQKNQYSENEYTTKQSIQWKNGLPTTGPPGTTLSVLVMV